MREKNQGTIDTGYPTLCRINTRTETYERFDKIGDTHQTSETYLTPSLVATRRQGL